MQPRPAIVDDASAIVALWDALMLEAYALDPRAGPPRPLVNEENLKWLRSTWFNYPDPFPSVLVADDEAGRPVGFVLARPVAPDCVHIGYLYVEPAWRGRGIGRALVLDLLDRAARAGHPVARVDALIRNERGLAFWRGLGFGDFMVTLARGVGQGS